MCTVTWIRESDGYQILFNRDEKHTRMPAAVPEPRSDENGVRFLAPRDRDHGGTWISVNDAGVCVCLLNGVGTAAGSSVSRGLLVLDLAGAQSAHEAVQRIAASELERFAPFVVLAVDADPGDAWICQWDGVNLMIFDHAPMHLTSSSFESEDVCARRRTAFEQHLVKAAGRISAESLFEFHQSHGAWPSAYSTCMHRDDAETVSFSWIRVKLRHVEFFYTPAAPCQWAPGKTIQLQRQEALAICS